MFVRLNYGGKEGPLVNTDNVVFVTPSATIGASDIHLLNGLSVNVEVPIEALESLFTGQPISATPLEI